MKLTQYITIDVSNICENIVGYPIDALTRHYTIAELQNGFDIITEKALWSDDCFSKNFHKDFIYTPKFRKLPYIKFQKIECAKFHQYKNIFGVSYLHYDEVTHNTEYYCGYVDENSNIVIPIIYERLGNFTEIEIIPAKLNNKYGMIDIQNKIVIPFEYDYLGAFHDGLAQYKQGKQRGYININGQKVINLSSSCQETYDFKRGQAKVGMWINGECLYGFIDHTGEFIIPPVYHSASEYGEYYLVSKKLASGFLIDKRGFQILNYHTEQQIALPLDKYHQYGDICGDLIKVARYYKSTSYSEKDKLLWGVITKTYRVIVPLEYDASQIQLIKGNYALINETNNDNYSLNKRYWTSIIGLDGMRTLLPDTCISVEYLNEHKLFKIKTDTANIHTLAEYKNSAIESIANLTSELIRPYWARHAAFRRNNLWGILSLETGRIIEPPLYHGILKLKDLIFVRKDKLYGVFSPNYNTDTLSYTPCTKQDWDNILQRRFQQNQNIIWWRRIIKQIDWENLGWRHSEVNGLVGIIKTETMETIIPPCYDRIELYKNDSNRLLFDLVKTYKKTYGLMKPNGALVVPCIHDNINNSDINLWKPMWGE